MPQHQKIKFIPDFDSSSAMIYSLGNFLAGREEGVGLPPKLPKMIGDIINVTPEVLRESIFKLSGISESLSLKELARLDDEWVSRWISDCYPQRKYPAVMIGSSNGAVMHICAALGIPWIPQTVLLAVARKMDPDELIEDAEWGREPARIIRDKIPYTRVYQMHDPIQDRMMVPHMGYFRVKRLRLGTHLEKYIENTLIPGGTIIVSDCRFRWPAKKMDGHHYFQAGGLGDVTGKEYAAGSERIREFLKKEGSRRDGWKTPEPLEELPEAEWGFDRELAGDIRRFAGEKNYRVRSLIFDHPETVSPLAADLARSWYAGNGINDRRLLVECFALIEPWWAGRTGAVPFWMAFNTMPSWEALDRYMRAADHYDEIFLMVMSNAIEGIGCVPIEKWHEVIRRAKGSGGFIGMDTDKYPHDLGSFIKYHKDLQTKINARHFMPHPMTIDEFAKFMDDSKDKYKVILRDQSG